MVGKTKPPKKKNSHRTLYLYFVHTNIASFSPQWFTLSSSWVMICIIVNSLLISIFCWTSSLLNHKRCNMHFYVILLAYLVLTTPSRTMRPSYKMGHITSVSGFSAGSLECVQCPLAVTPLCVVWHISEAPRIRLYGIQLIFNLICCCEELAYLALHSCLG